jgi:hypothetical protein
MKRYWWFALILLSLLPVATGCTRSESATADTAPQIAPLPGDAELHERLDAVINFSRDKRRLNTRDHAAWQVVHGALEFGRDFTIDHQGKPVGALDHLLGGGKLRGWDLRKGDRGVIALVEPGSKSGQGHPDQWLGYLSICGLTPADKLVVGGEEFTVNDLITQAQWDLKEGMEATWTLMAFAVFLPIDSKWKAKDGSDWTIERMVAMEAAVDPSTRACGGTHCLYGLAVALKRYKKEGGDLSKEPWKSIDQRIYGYKDPDTGKHVDGLIDKARQFQQPDGSLSTQFFERPGGTANLEQRIHATGHTFEFLCTVMTDEQIREPWMTRAAVSLIDMLERTEDFSLECGALYHAVHGLDLYRSRRFGSQ